MGITRSSDLWLGLDIGGTKLLGLAMRRDLSIAGSLKKPTRRDDGPEAVVERILDLAKDLIGRFGSVSGIGVGFAGLVDWRMGRVMSSIMLPGWDDYPLAEKLSAPLGGLPVFLDNDATAAGYGEYLALGAPKGMNMVLLTVGTGIGGAILINGRLYRGATSTSAEFGNTTIDWKGKTCWCGNEGCLNMLASGSAMAERAGTLTVEEARKSAAAGNAKAAQAIEEGACALGAGVANIINIFNPDRVVLTGGVTALGEDFLVRVRKEAFRRAFSESAAHARIEYSVLGVEVGALGAAGLIRDHVEGR